MLGLVVTALLVADESLGALDRQVASKPSDPFARIEAAQKRLQQGEELDRALLDLDVARSILPENPRVHFLYGQLMEERGDVAGARAAYETALALRDDYDDARFRLAGLLMQAQAFAEAAAAYGRYAKAHPDATGARLQHAAALEKSGDVAGAEKELKALFADAKTRGVAGFKLAELYERHGRHKEAVKVRAAVEPPKRKLRDLKPSGR